MRGNRSSIQGRPRALQRVSKQHTIEVDAEGVVRHKLPSKKRRTAPSKEHSLQAAVIGNRRTSKKH